MARVRHPDGRAFMAPAASKQASKQDSQPASHAWPFLGAAAALPCVASEPVAIRRGEYNHVGKGGRGKGQVRSANSPHTGWEDPSPTHHSDALAFRVRIHFLASGLTWERGAVAGGLLLWTMPGHVRSPTAELPCSSRCAVGSCGVENRRRIGSHPSKHHHRRDGWTGFAPGGVSSRRHTDRSCRLSSSTRKRPRHLNSPKVRWQDLWTNSTRFRCSVPGSWERAPLRAACMNWVDALCNGTVVLEVLGVMAKMIGVVWCGVDGMGCREVGIGCA